MINVADVLADPDFVEEVTVLRRTLTMTAGVASYGELEEAIFASIQPASGEDLKTLPEGHQLDDAIMVYTTAELRADAPSRAADGLVVRGRRYIVRSVPQPFRQWGYTGAVATAEAVSGVEDA